MQKKTILFTCALPAELKSVKSECKKLRLKGIQIKFLLTGVGNYKTIYNLKSYLESKEYKVDFIVNIGLCGMSKNTENTKYIQIYRIVGAANGRELLCPIYIDFIKKFSILSSEKVITSEGQLEGEDYVDMESYAIDLVSSEEKIPYIIIKKPFDIVSKSSLKIDPQKFENCLNDFNYKKLLDSIISFLKTNEDPAEILKQKQLKKTLKIYKFSFSEQEIWKKGYSRLIAFGGDYDFFLFKFRKLNKKLFLKHLSEIKEEN